MLAFLRRRAVLKGVFGGSRQWTIVWAVLLGVRLLKKLTADKPEILLTHEIEPGESLLVSGVDREPRVLGSAGQ